MFALFWLLEEAALRGCEGVVAAAMGDQVEKDAVHELAEDLLCKNWVESRPAIMGRQRVEIFLMQTAPILSI